MTFTDLILNQMRRVVKKFNSGNIQVEFVTDNLINIHKVLGSKEAFNNDITYGSTDINIAADRSTSAILDAIALDPGL